LKDLRHTLDHAVFQGELRLPIGLILLPLQYAASAIGEPLDDKGGTQAICVAVVRLNRKDAQYSRFAAPRERSDRHVEGGLTSASDVPVRHATALHSDTPWVFRVKQE